MLLGLYFLTGKKKARNNYDPVIKGLFQRERPSVLLEQLTGGVAVRQVLNVELSKPLERRADAVFLLADGSIFHLEVQTSNDDEMPYREGVYGFLLGQKYKRRRINQAVLYLGEERLRMPSELDLGQAKVAYTLIDIREIDAARLLASGRPADLALAILARGGRERLQEILRRVADLREGEREKVMDEIAALSGLRRLEGELIMEVERMATIEEIFLKVPKFQAIIRNERREAAREAAQKADRNGRAEMLSDLLKSKFRTLPKWASEKLESATPVQVRRWSKKVLTANTIEDVLGKRHTH